MDAPWTSWLEQPKAVRARSTFRVAAPYEQVAALLRRPDATLLLRDTVDLVPVPSSSLQVTVLRRDGVTALDVVAVEREEDAARSRFAWTSRTTALTTTLEVQPAGRTGARLTLELGHPPVARPQARGWQDVLDLSVRAWRDRVTAVATGFQPFPQAQPSVLAATQPALPASTGHLVGARDLPYTPEQVWRALALDDTADDGLVEFRTGGAQLAVGDVRWSLRQADHRMYVQAMEVEAVVLGRSLVLRRLGHPFHPSRTTWAVNSAQAGVVLTYDHECATPHDGSYDYVGAALDAVESRLSER